MLLLPCRLDDGLLLQRRAARGGTRRMCVLGGSGDSSVRGFQETTKWVVVDVHPAVSHGLWRGLGLWLGEEAATTVSPSTGGSMNH